MRISQLSVLLTSLVSTVVSSAVLTPKEVDWKYAVGWDGVTLPASDIGSTLSTGSDLEVRVPARLSIASSFDVNVLPAEA